MSLETIFNIFWKPFWNLIQRLLNKNKSSSRRLRKAISLLREDTHSTDLFSNTKIAESLKLEKVSDLEKLLDGTNEPSFNILDIFSNIYGINKEWLKHGESQPFRLAESPMYTDKDFIEEIKGSDLEVIYFVRNDNDEAQVTIVLECEDNKYLTYPDVAHLSSHVGGTGKVQLAKFHSFLSYTLNQMDVTARGCTISPEDFKELSWGHMYPGKLLTNRWDRTQNWWDDFIFLYKNEEHKKRLTEKYGDEYVKAQDIVRQHNSQNPTV